MSRVRPSESTSLFSRLRRYVFQRAQLALLAAGLAAIGAAGCGKSENRVPVHPASGKLTFQGAAPAGAVVTLIPTENSSPVGITPKATVAADGGFRLGVYAEGDGAPAGDYVATVQWFKPVENASGSGFGPNVLPRQYADAKTSPWKVTIKPGENQLPPVELSAK